MGQRIVTGLRWIEGQSCVYSLFCDSSEPNEHVRLRVSRHQAGNANRLSKLAREWEAGDEWEHEGRVIEERRPSLQEPTNRF